MWITLNIKNTVYSINTDCIQGFQLRGINDEKNQIIIVYNNGKQGTIECDNEHIAVNLYADILSALNALNLTDKYNAES